MKQDIYQQRSYWKAILAIFGGIILIITVLYSNYLAKNLINNEQKNAKLYTSALEFSLNDKNMDNDVSLSMQITSEFPLPCIIEYEGGSREAWNFDDSGQPITDENFIKDKIAAFLKSGQTPISGELTNLKVYYFNSKLLQYIKFYPLVQILLIGSYMGLGYFLFNSSRKAEQNRVWAGMAKETAHQLGTPISAIMGWIDHMRSMTEDNGDYGEVLYELEKDVDRLNLVADRFSKIGSSPELKSVDLNMQLEDVLKYMERRASRKVTFDPLQTTEKTHFAMINEHLFQWVVENLIRNALDAMDGKGQLKVAIYDAEGFVCIDVTDSGKGIPPGKFKTVFQPGYSTKQRGWGLGLSLAKRIIENYHNGKIFVKASKPGEGTTFTIKLRPPGKISK
ncbi:MAG: HAMP domain-containing histidine kinase [Saprospiraceae bacterium]|nr:HAMP domain-containing histidine kinase [Saprospiraceae bacterium]